MQRLADKLLGAKEDLDELKLELKVVQGKAKASQLKDSKKKLGTEEQ